MKGWDFSHENFKVQSVSKLSKPQIRTLAAVTNVQKLLRAAPSSVATVDYTSGSATTHLSSLAVCFHKI